MAALGDVIRGLKTVADCALRGAALDELQARKNVKIMVMQNIMMFEILDGSFGGN